jgi:Cu(I)/Ag(I) efflux system membrane fusion protein
MRKALYLLLLVAGLIAGMALSHLRAADKRSVSHRILYYKDPMHPSYRSDKPGVAPDCGMELVPIYADEAVQSLASDRAAMDNGVSIDPEIQQLYGIRLARAERDQGKGAIQVFARVQPDETQIYRINFGTEGYVKQTQGDAAGEFVTKNQHLATVYSPDFLAVAGGFLAAHERDPTASNAPNFNLGTNASQEAASVQARADRLRNLGMSDAQLDEITRTRKLPEDVYVVSPTDGFILTRNISPGMRFDRGVELYSIANLSHVWIVAEVYGRDTQAFRPGVEALITLPDGGQTLRAKVSNVLPEVDPVTRATKVRLEADNPGYKLRPNMFVSVAVPIALPAGISVPAEAILDSGASKRVFVRTSDSAFESRPVETGWQLGDRVQVAKGLKEGEMVVASGTFLVDSESRLRSANPIDQASTMNHSTGHSMN